MMSPYINFAFTEHVPPRPSPSFATQKKVDKYKHRCNNSKGFLSIISGPYTSEQLHD